MFSFVGPLQMTKRMRKKTKRSNSPRSRKLSKSGVLGLITTVNCKLVYGGFKG
jgi:hypothetical protein